MAKYMLIKERKWALCLIFLILFFNPLFYFWSGNDGLERKCISWVICFVTGLAFTGIELFLKGWRERLFLCTLFLLSLAPNLITWSYLYLSGLYMYEDMYWVIFNSNPRESTEYVREFISAPVVAAGVVYIVACLFFILKTKSKQALSAKRWRLLWVVSILIILGDLSLQYLSHAVPTLEFYKSFLLFKRESYLFEQERAQRSGLRAEVACTLPDSTRHVFVILLGESATTCHLSLYGYHRQTSPRMDARGSELDVFTDVVTPDTHTYGVMQKALTFANHQHPEYYKTKASVVELFNAAGFDSWWIANNPILDKWGASYGVIAEEADHLIDLSVSGKTDEVVINSFQNILADSSATNKVIFIHLMGNHHPRHLGGDGRSRSGNDDKRRKQGAQFPGDDHDQQGVDHLLLSQPGQKGNADKINRRPNPNGQEGGNTQGVHKGKEYLHDQDAMGHPAPEYKSGQALECPGKKAQVVKEVFYRTSYRLHSLYFNRNPPFTQLMHGRQASLTP